MVRNHIMPNRGQRSITFGGEVLKRLEQLYAQENSENVYPISFSQFIASHALNDLVRRTKEKTKEK
jgi:hypothetical protein